jgi:hypothetical protein
MEGASERQGAMTLTDDNYDQQDNQPRGALTSPERAGYVARRDFAGQSLAVQNPMTEAVAAQERAMVEARYIMAMRRPRNFDDVRADIIAECKRPGFAEVATYARPVGREKDEETGQWKDVFAEGLSIRFAEVALRRMGNMACTARVLHDDAVVRMVQITALDYESGGSWEEMITVTKTAEVKNLKKGQRPLSERVNSYGDRVFIVEANEQRFAAKLGAEISKASRKAILRLVPGEIQDEAFELCKKVAADREAKDPAAAKKRMLDGFGEVGVRPSEIVQWLGHPVEQGTRDEFVQLSKILSGLRERELVWSEVLAERIEERAKANPATRPAPAQVTDPAAPAAAAQPTKNSGGKGTQALKNSLPKTPRAPVAEGDRPPTPEEEAVMDGA